MLKKSSSTRDEILKLLKVHHKMTVSKLAKHLQITEMAVRRHLQTLERDHYIQASVVRQAMGRPYNVYQLSTEGQDLFPNNYQGFVLDFIKDIEEIAGPSMVEQLLEKRHDRLKGRYEERMDGKSFDERINELAAIQNENGYMVNLKQEDDGAYRLIEYNCPISSVAQKYDKACQCELELFRKVLKTQNIERKSCIGLEGTTCDYIIKE